MAPVAVLTRASLDLRGVRPSEAELEAVEADPAALDGILDGMVADERFFARLVPLYQEIYLTWTEAMPLRPDNLGLEDPKFFYWQAGQEPLEILAEVAREDLPWTEVVEADWTMSNEDLAAFFPVEWPEGQTGWHKTRYTDGRPAAGVVSTNGLWWRYTTTDSNANRRRANALSRITVCQDILDRAIGFDSSVNLLDEAAIEDALHNNPSCENCHVSLDPIAANLFGFYWSNFTSPTQGMVYHPGQERAWEDMLGTPPGWYGTPTDGLVNLGATIAADPRFATCAVEQAFELMLRRETTVSDADDLVELRDTFLANDMSIRSLFRAVVDLPVYRAADLDSERGVPVKMATPDVLGTAMEDLTGYSWDREDHPVLLTDRLGVRGLGGGVDGMQVKRAATEPGATVLLVQKALATEAAAWAVEQEQAMSADDRRLFTEIDFTETADDRAVRLQLAALHRRVLGETVDPDGAEVDADLELWRGLAAIEPDVPSVWRDVLAAFLRDPDFLLY